MTLRPCEHAVPSGTQSNSNKKLRVASVLLVHQQSDWANSGFEPRSLDSAHQSKSEICKQRTDRTSVLTVPLRRRVIPP